MVRLSTVCLFVALAVSAVAATGPETVPLRSPAHRERQMLQGPRGTNMRIERSRRPSARDVLVGSERIRGGFLAPRGARDLAMAQRAFTWLAQVSALYRWDLAVAPVLLGVYSDIGDVYNGYPAEYRPWQWSAYAGAGWLCRALVLTSAGNQRYEEALERYALNVVALNYLANNAVSFVPPVFTGAKPPTVPTQPKETLSPLPIPEVDEEALAPERRALWADARSRFRTVSVRVYRVRVLLDELSARLSERGLTLNRADAATAVKMQGFLEDSVELIQALQFEQATEALVRADYERAKLKTVIGQ